MVQFFFPLTCTLTGSQSACAISNHAKGVEKCHRQVFPSLDVRVMFPPDVFLSLCSLFDPTRVGASCWELYKDFDTGRGGGGGWGVLSIMALHNGMCQSPLQTFCSFYSFFLHFSLNIEFCGALRYEEGSFSTQQYSQRRFP